MKNKDLSQSTTGVPSAAVSLDVPPQATTSIPSGYEAVELYFYAYLPVKDSDGSTLMATVLAAYLGEGSEAGTGEFLFQIQSVENWPNWKDAYIQNVTQRNDVFLTNSPRGPSWRVLKKIALA